MKTCFRSDEITRRILGCSEVSSFYFNWYEIVEKKKWKWKCCPRAFLIIRRFFMPNPETHKESVGENPKQFPFTNMYVFDTAVSVFSFFHGLFMLRMDLKIQFYGWFSLFLEFGTITSLVKKKYCKIFSLDLYITLLCFN